MERIWLEQMKEFNTLWNAFKILTKDYSAAEKAKLFHDNAQRIYEAAKHPKSFVSLDDADHLLSRKEDAEYVAGVIAARFLSNSLHDTASSAAVKSSRGGIRYATAREL